MNLSQIKSRYAGIQTKMRQIGDYGCLFLALCTIIEEVTGKPIDLITVIQESKSKGWLAEDYTVTDSLSLLEAFTGKKWWRDIERKLPDVIADNQFTIEKWHNARTGYTHFKRRFVDTLTSSVTVKEGKIREYYIYSY